MAKVVIIGNGIAGITAARHVRKRSDHDIFVISGETKYFFSRTALMYVYMGHMKFEHTQPYENWFWAKNKIKLIQAWVDFIDPTNKRVALKSGDVVPYNKLIIATGSVPRQLEIPGLGLKGVQSLYSRQDLELMEENTRECRRAVVVGGGLIGIEMAEMLHSRGIHVTMVVRENSFWDIVLPGEESQMVTGHILSRGIKLRLNSTAVAIEGVERARSVILDNGDSLQADFVGITIGVQPNIALANKAGIETNKGILVDGFLQTSEEDIYAIGDCAELRTPAPGRRAVEPVWYSGRIMGETVAATITGTATAYNPGHWFNSAKFFDLEYQTYGYVPSREMANLKQYYWQDEQEEKALRFVTNEAGEVVGINALGIRLRQDVCEHWFDEQITVEQALTRLDEIDFNPEFSGPLAKLIKRQAVI